MFYRPREWEAQYRTDEPIRGGKTPQPDIGTSLAQLLEFFAPLFQARNALDLGTGMGYSAHVLARVVGNEGNVLAVERDPALARRARENLKKNGLDKRVAVIMGEAGDVLHELTGPYDVILLDVDKAQYVDLLPRIVELLPIGGHLVADDIGFLSRDFDPRLRPLSLHIGRFVKAILQRSDMDCIYIPLGDGLIIARKVQADTEKQLSIFAQKAANTDQHTPGVPLTGSEVKEAEAEPEEPAKTGISDPEATVDETGSPIPRNLATSVSKLKPPKSDG